MKLWSEKKLESLFMFLSHPKMLRTRNLFGTTVYMINSPEDQHIKYFVFALKFKKKIKLQNHHESSETESQCSDKIYDEEYHITMEE